MGGARSEERGARVRSAQTIDFVHHTSFLFWWFVEGGDGEENDQADEAGGPDYFADDADVEEHANAGGVAHGLQQSGDPNEDGSDDRQGDREGKERFGGRAEGHGLGADCLTSEFTDEHGSGVLLKRPLFSPRGQAVSMRPVRPLNPRGKSAPRRYGDIDRFYGDTTMGVGLFSASFV